MQKTLEKYGIGIFVQPPVLPETLETKIDITAPEGVAVSCTEHSAIITVPEGFVADEPIRMTVSGRVKVTMAIEPHANVVVEEMTEDDDREFTLDLYVGENAHVTYRTVQSSAGSDFAKRNATVAASGKLTWQDVVFGGSFGRSFVTTRLVGEGAETQVEGRFFGTGKQEFDIYHEVVHEASHTRSNLAARGVLNDKAKTVYRGLVRIEEGAVGCTGRQKEDTLLLSKTAEIDTVPNLEIANDDVQCSHATTTGRLDDEKLFYLMSRGLDHETATKTYVEGFIGIEDEPLRETILKKLSRLSSSGLTGGSVRQIPNQVGNDRDKTSVKI